MHLGPLSAPPKMTWAVCAYCGRRRSDSAFHATCVGCGAPIEDRTIVTIDVGDKTPEERYAVVRRWQKAQLDGSTRRLLLRTSGMPE